MHLIPQPDHGELVVRIAELAAQQRPPDRIVRALVHVALDPRLGGDRFVPRAVRLASQPERGQAHADAVEQRRGPG